MLRKVVLIRLPSNTGPYTSHALTIREKSAWANFKQKQTYRLTLLSMLFISVKLLKNLHLYYLNRLLRMFPVLATAILLQVSIFNWVADGPFWNVLAEETHKCRVFWWSTLLHIQNYVNPGDIVSVKYLSACRAFQNILFTKKIIR